MMTIYYQEWKEKGYACEECDWKGNGSDCNCSRFHRKNCLEVYCPSCGAFLDLIIFPYAESCGKETEKLTDEQKKKLQKEEELMRLYQEKCLRSPDQLLEIDGADFTLQWDQVEGETRITKGDTVVWSEPLVYEGFERYERIALILKEKYGSRVKDLIPADRSMLFLYGDFAPSIDHVKKVRKDLFGIK